MTKGDAVGGLAVEGMAGVDDDVAVGEFADDGLGGEFIGGIGQAGGKLFKGVGGDEFGIAAPGVVTGVDPALEILGVGTVDGVGFDDAMRFGLRMSGRRGGDGEKGEEQS